VLVLDSRKDARAASAGAILVTRLMQRGVAGAVTDGGFRDSTEIAKLGFPAYHQRPSAPTNLTLHMAIEINVPIGCGDAPVFPGNVILGDSDGERSDCTAIRVRRAPHSKRQNSRYEEPLTPTLSPRRAGRGRRAAQAGILTHTPLFSANPTAHSANA
jgi:regulator of RNase E activity RraA